MKKTQIFISYATPDGLEAGLLQFAFERLLEDKGITTWTFQRDQKLSQKEIATSLKQKVEQSIATVFLISPSTLASGATQWMELAYADAFGVETYILLHHLEYSDLKAKEHGVPPLLLSSQCNSALKWKKIAGEISKLVNS